jgi:hypothetical protein
MSFAAPGLTAPHAASLPEQHGKHSESSLDYEHVEGTDWQPRPSRAPADSFGDTMPYDLDPDDITTIRARLGPALGELRRTMLDVDTPPFRLFSDDRPRLAKARMRAVEILDQWVAEEPEAASKVYARLPKLFQGRSVAESLAEAVTWADYFDLPSELFEKPALDSRVFAAAPHLAPLLDESGLITVTGLDARPWGVHTGEYAFQYHQLLRRNFGSGIHYGLIGAVLRLAEQYDLTARLALDERRVRFKDEYIETCVPQMWAGPGMRICGLTCGNWRFRGDGACH